MNTVRGLHHVTCIAGPVQENLDFYAGVLGMRLVKRSVNQTESRRSWPEHGSLVSRAAGQLVFWSARLQRYGVPLANAEVRFGEHVLPVRDPHGLRLALVESANSLDRPLTPWEDSPIPAEYQIRGLEGARMSEASLQTTTSFLETAMGFQHIGTEGEWLRYGIAGGKSGRYVDVREVPDARRGAWGTGSIHHLAWRVDDEAHQSEVRSSVEAGGARPTPMIDCFWFKSVYFKEPGGVLFELATDGPGFAVDEDPQHLGETLVLPPWLEPDRAAIEGSLPKLTMPARRSLALASRLAGV